MCRAWLRGVAITVKCEKEDITDTITLEGGKVNQHDVTVPMADMPGSFENVLIEENFEEQTDPDNFGFSHGTKIENGKLVLTAGSMGKCNHSS